MKRTVILCLMSMFLLSGCGSESSNKSEKMDCISSQRMSFDNYTSENIRIVLNKNSVRNFADVANTIVRKYENNTFDSIYFSSKADKLNVAVYLHQNDTEPVMEFVYSFITNEYICTGMGKSCGKNCMEIIKPDDTLIIPGDYSWGLTLEECMEDLNFIAGL